MHTFGAVILAIVGVLLMQAVLLFIASFLFAPMYASVGIILPVLLLMAFSGFAYYGGLIFALGLVPKANATTVGWIVAALVVAGTLYGTSRNFNREPFEVTVVALLTGVAALFGTVIGSRSASLNQET